MSHATPSDSEPVLDGLNIDSLDTAGRQRMLVVTVPQSQADLASDRFWQLGVRGVSEVDRPDGKVDVVSSVGNDQGSIDRAVATFDPGWVWRVDDVSTRASEAWRDHARPVRYRPHMVMVPAWMPAHPDVEPNDHVTLVEPGSAFGLGDHPTTRGSMAALALLLDDPTTVGSVLDVGCGTGVLAILAAQHGVPIVRAIDVSDAAVSSTLHNAELNDVVESIDVDTTPLDQIVDRFDVVVANILAPVLVSLAPALVRAVAPSGALVISGVLADRHRHVLDALAPLEVAASTVDDGWATVTLRA